MSKWIIGFPIFLSMIFIDYLTTIVHAIEYRLKRGIGYRSGCPDPLAHHGYLKPRVLIDSIVRGYRGQFHR